MKKKQPQKVRPLNVHVKDETHKQLDSVAGKHGVTKSDLVRSLLRIGMRELNGLGQSFEQGEIDELQYHEYMHDFYRKDI